MKGDLMKYNEKDAREERIESARNPYQSPNTPLVQIKEPGEMDKMIRSYVGSMIHKKNPQAFEMFLKLSKTHKDFITYAAGFLGISPKMAMEIESENTFYDKVKKEEAIRGE
jgi:hypothetical protein